MRRGVGEPIRVEVVAATGGVPHQLERLELGRVDVEALESAGAVFDAADGGGARDVGRLGGAYAVEGLATGGIGHSRVGEAVLALGEKVG